MQVTYAVNAGYIDTSKFAPEISDKLLPEATRAELTKVVPKLEAAWKEVSATCPRQRQETIGLARDFIKHHPADAKALEALRVLTAEPDQYVQERHQAAHSRFNELTVSIACHAIAALKALRAEIEARAQTARSLWNQIEATFPESLSDVRMPDVIEARVANTVRGIDERIAALRQPTSNESAITLSDLGIFPNRPGVRQSATGDYCNASDLDAARAA